MKKQFAETRQVSFIKMGESAKRHNQRLAELLEAAKNAADWLCDSYKGSDQRERGERLNEAIRAMKFHSDP